MTHTIYGTSFRDVAKQERLDEFVAFQQKEEMKVFYVLPSRIWLSKGLERQKNLHYLNFDELAQLFIQKIEPNIVSITEHERTLFFQQFVERNQYDFEMVETLGQSKGFADTYGQLKRLGLTLDDIPESLIQLKNLFEEYEKQILKDNKMYDPENHILFAVELLKKYPIDPVRIVVDGFYSFNPLQYLLIKTLKEIGMSLEIYLPNDRNFSIVEQTRLELGQIGFTDHYRLAEANEVNPKRSLAAASTKEEELKAILYEIAQSDLPFSEQAILFANEREDITPLLEQAKRYQIPFQTAKQKKLSETGIYHLLQLSFEKQGGPLSKWDSLALFEQVLSLSFLEANKYIKEKKTFLSEGQAINEQVQAIFKTTRNWTWPKKASFMDYLNILKQFLEELNWQEIWVQKLREEEELVFLKNISTEKRALEKLEEKINEQLVTLTDRGLGSLFMNQELFYEWLKESSEAIELFIERGHKDGVALHTWRDIGLFKGQKLFVVGMNEGIFPRSHTLSGYLNERDLSALPIVNGAPSQLLSRKSQEAFFQQLFYVAKEIVFSYVRGLDAAHPHLPSPILEGLEMEKKDWTFVKRSQLKNVLGEEEQEELLSYFVGKGYALQKNVLPAHLKAYQKRLQRLELFEESIEKKHQQKRKKGETTVTALEAYARCPFKYAMERELQIQEPVLRSEQVSPLDIGDFVHDIIESIYKELQLIGVPFSSISDDVKRKVPSLLEQKFEDGWEEIVERNAEISALDLKLLKKLWKRRLKKWWLAERKHFWDNDRIPSMKIEALEAPIYFDFTLSTGENLYLRGKIDRVDTDQKGFTIYDYKTGQASIKKEEIQAGLKLQLPLYAYVMQKQLSDQLNQEMTGYGASYISLRDPEKRAGNGVWRPDFIGKDSPFFVSSRTRNQESTWATDDYMNENELPEKIEKLWKGTYTEYPVKPLDCSDFCPYKPICRVTEEQKERGSSDEV
ncbi:PD-(D/E)XK nuclease family protein [Alkalihalobacillus sp. 1P02AB]|uniref:PD-(D/E)XK nuclease family protein n=1 Tax=Alkalihalobacillus sp. 1P02AB TaxID=3132260 RepID=UPI0039A568A3